jgi:sugar (pentulose or hexulose) kinase
MMSYFLGIDLGTSYFKIGIFDETGNLKGLSRQYVHKVSNGAICELPIEIFWKTIRDGLDEAIQIAGIQKNAIKSVSYSSQVNSFILLDVHHQPLTPLILWLDERSSNLELPIGNPDELMKRTGLGITPNSQFTVAKLHWFRKYHPDVWEKVANILSISDFLTFSLTGNKVCDYSTASMTGLFDIRNNLWWSEQLENFGIHADMLPALQRIGTCSGTTTKKASNLTGIPPDIPFCLGGLDHHMAAVGAGIPSNGYISESTGTVLSCVDYTDNFSPQNNICIAPGLHVGSFFRMMFNENGASSLEWYQKKHAPEYSIPELLEMAAKVELGCEGLIAYPSAYTYPGLSGFTNTKNIHCQHGHHVKALLESTAHSLFQLVTELKKGKPFPSIVSSGGGSRSELWVKIKSEITNTRFFIPECTESACMGAAMMGALGTNTFGSYDEMVDVWVKFRKKM